MQNLDNQEGNEGKQAANRGWSWLIPVAAILVACFVIACSTTVLGWIVYVTERRTTRASVLSPSLGPQPAQLHRQQRGLRYCP